MVSVVIARHEPAPRRRRPWHAQKPSAREPGGSESMLTILTASRLKPR